MKGEYVMKNVKKAMSWLIVLVMVCSLVGCGKETKKPTAEEVYKAAYEKVNQMNDMDATMDMDIIMTAEGESIEMGVESDILMEDINKETMRMNIGMAMDMLGMTIDIQAYYVDGYYLMELMGQKMKYVMSLEDAMGQTSTVQEVNLEAMSEITMVEEEENRVISYKVDGTKLKEGYMESILSNMEGMGMSSEEAMEAITFQEISGTMTVNGEGYATEISMDMSFTMEMEGTVIDCQAIVEMEYHNPGQDVTVEIPDPSDYIEVDPNTMG